MKLPFTGLSSIHKLFIALSLIFFAAMADLYLFTRKSSEVELYDDLTGRISTMRVSITTLEYLLDMFVVARRFESTTIEVIKGDVDKLEENVSALLGDSRFIGLFYANAPLSEGIVSIAEDWENIKVEIGRLNDALNQDEIMLIHNAVDIHTVLIIEKTDRLLSIISDGRQAVFEEIRGLEIKSVAGFLILSILASLAYYKKVVSPTDKAGRVARRVASGNLEARFPEGGGLAGRLGSELNGMLEVLAREREDLKVRNSAAEELLAGEGLKVKAFSELMSFAGSSLSQGSVLEKALSEGISGSGADAGAVFIEEDGELRFKAGVGFGSGAARGLQQVRVHVPKGEAMAPVPFPSVTEYPDAPFAEFLKSCGFESLLRLPIIYNKRALGFIFVIYRQRVEDISPVQPFLEAIASGTAVSIGHAGLLQGEHNSRRFVERLIHQVPFGLAVFDKSGFCRLMNASLRKMLGAERVELAGSYSIFDDEVLTSGGILSSIKKAYEGYTTEFVIDYDPAEIKKFSFNGPQRRLRIKSFPLFDAGGDISNIVLLYEDISDQPPVAANSGDAL